MYIEAFSAVLPSTPAISNRYQENAISKEIGKNHKKHTTLPLFKYTPHNYRLPTPYVCETKVAKVVFNPLRTTREKTLM